MSFLFEPLAPSCNILSSIPSVESLFRVSGFTWKARIDNYFHISDKVVKFVQLVSVGALCKACTGIWETIAADRACDRFQPTSANSCWVAEWRPSLVWGMCALQLQRQFSRFKEVCSHFFLRALATQCLHSPLASKRKGESWRRTGCIFPLLIMGPSSALRTAYKALEMIVCLASWTHLEDGWIFVLLFFKTASYYVVLAILELAL